MARKPLSKRIKARLWGPMLEATAWSADKLRHDLVPRHFYTPIPDWKNLPDELFERPDPMIGVELDLDAQFELLERELAPFVAELDWPREPTGDRSRFNLANGSYETVDAEALYAMVRRSRPRRVLELGAGASTLVIAEARARNAAEGSDFEHVVMEPFPELESQFALPEGIDLRPIGATDVPLAEFEALGSGDVLFIDTTHTVKTGGDVVYLLLRAVPSVAPGVIVQVHDIFLPWEYPREWVVEHRRWWAEQYMLQAFLAFNSDFETLLAGQALCRADRDRLARSVPSLARFPEASPGCWWLRRKDG